MAQLRNVLAELHRRLKARAAVQEMTMSAYVLRELRKAVARPTRQEVLERLAAQPRRRLHRTAADVVRAGRDAR